MTRGLIALLLSACAVLACEERDHEFASLAHSHSYGGIRHPLHVHAPQSFSGSGTRPEPPQALHETSSPCQPSGSSTWPSPSQP